VLYRDLPETARMLERQHPGDGQRWVEFVGPYVAAFDAVRATMLCGFPPARGPLLLLRALGPARGVDFARLLAGSAVGLGRRLFRGDGSRAWLYGAAFHGDTRRRSRGRGLLRSV